MTTSRSSERGSAPLEYVAMIAVAAVVAVAVAVGSAPASVGGILTTAVCTVKSGAACAQPGGGPSADTGDRRSQEHQTRDGRRGRGSDKSPGGTGTSGQPTHGDPLGTGEPGTSVATPPPPPWQPPDSGAGKYDSQRAWPWDHAKKLAAELAANLLAGTWPDASRNLSHYLANTGQPLQQDVDKILSDVPGFQAAVNVLTTSVGEDAVLKAQASGATGPLTYPLSTDWQGYYIGPEQNKNWFYALGGVSYNLTGQVTVYPPTSPGGAWRYVVTKQVNLRDQYNWDGGKSTQIGPFTVTDKQMAALHRQGLAREYLNEGTSGTTTTKGSVP